MPALPTSPLPAQALPVGEVTPKVLPLSSEHQIAAARRSASAMLTELGFRPPASNYVVTAVSELASNLVFHARRGQVLTLRPVMAGGPLGRIGIEVVSEDSGPGIDDLEAAMRDGFSTNGGLGAGLPGVKRLMDEFEIRSTPGKGTVVLARKWRR